MRSARRAASGVRKPSKLSTAFDRLPIRVRLAGVSALLTFVILCAFAVAIGSLTVHRIRSDFNREVDDTATQLVGEMHAVSNPVRGTFTVSPPLQYIAPAGEHSVIRLLSEAGHVQLQYPANARRLGAITPQPHLTNGYRVVSRELVVLNSRAEPIGRLFLQYGRPVAPVESTVHRVELLLIGGVIIGSVLALFAGIAIARRAMAPIADLTSAAAAIARTRDPSKKLPEPQADDEVAELARTLEGMLRQLDAARSETEAALARQRAFVADASHELRTPLTSVLANLELLAESLDGDQGEAARSALRSSQRMRRLVADLLLLARTDAGRTVPRERCDLGEIALEAAAELEPVSDRHEITLDVHPAPLDASRDELHRLVLNLVENAIKHTPPGTSIRASTRALGHDVELVVEDDGPGVPPEIAPTLFERFVRGAGDRGGSVGLGLAIVQAVAGSHGGTVRLEPRADGARGARFVVRLPGAAAPADSPQRPEPALADRSA